MEIRFKNTPENIDSLLHNEIFVFGSNTEGIHGAGAALIAYNKFGAKIGVPIGLCGNSYGIITKDLKTPNNILLSMILDQLYLLYQFASLRKDLVFYVTKIGTGLGGFSVENIRDVFQYIDRVKPENIVLPIEFQS